MILKNNHIDAEIPKTCNGHGKLVDSDNGINCECDTGFDGRFCEIS